MAIFQQGAINTTALVVPGLYVQIVPPQQLLLNGVPSNRLGVVGTASWGPVNTATLISDMRSYAGNFGPIQNRKYDMGTAVAVATQQGASDFRCVRVTDGTDTKAASTGVATCVTFAAIYSGSLGNSLSAAIATGSKTGTFKLTVGLPNLTPEVFDNIAGSGNAFWVALAAAVNNGNSVLRGPSQLITAASAAGTTAPTAQAFTFTAGTDGVATLTAAVLVGSDATRTGMYALRSQGCALGVLADADDSTQWSTIDGFGLSEGLYMIQVVPAGTTIAAAVTAKGSAGLDSYASKLMHGDWLFWNDPVNGLLRLVSPQGFMAGRLANLSPNNSSLNKPIYGVAGTQKSGVAGSAQTQQYSQAELTLLIQAGIDLIANPSPGGTYFGAQAGHNSSSNAAIQGDNYTRMTNYIAATLNAGMGIFVGRLVNVNLFRDVKSTLMSFYANLATQGLIGSPDGSLPYSVVCDITNNPASRTGLGYVQVDSQVKYLAINEKFIVNVEGGQTVSIARQLVQ